MALPITHHSDPSQPMEKQSTPAQAAQAALIGPSELRSLQVYMEITRCSEIGARAVFAHLHCLEAFRSSD